MTMLDVKLHALCAGYDACIGYFLGFEDVLAAHDHGHKFALDKQMDAAFKNVVKQNILDAAETVAPTPTPTPALTLTPTATQSLALNVCSTGRDAAPRLAQAVHRAQLAPCGAPDPQRGPGGGAAPGSPRRSARDGGEAQGHTHSALELYPHRAPSLGAPADEMRCPVDAPCAAHR